MNDLPPHRRPRRFILYFIVLVATAVATLFPAISALPAAEPLTLLLVLAFMTLGEAGAVSLPTGGYVSVGAVFDLASLLLLGPGWTAILSAVSALITQGGVLRKPMVRVEH